ncbi:MAG: YkgJ family cysteine cluster protein [Lachnospiraceae bacterium]|nr:YkgJ family cysteine cluster protein [Lachnospiraceae bacterium]
MLRDVSMDAISDGNLYTANDMVKLGCNDCKGCSDCCRDMGESIVLDPYDVFRLTSHLNRSFESMIDRELTLGVVDGLILPSIQMDNENACCAFLDENGRCSVHQARPGICRLFPLGRIYEENGFKYFLQVDECSVKNRTKVKIKKWLGEKDYYGYEKYILSWHELLVNCREYVQTLQEQEKIKAISMRLLTEFYVKGYDKGEDFFTQFEQRKNRL